jgi:hypothetical protein
VPAVSDETKRLAETFNDMLVRLDKAFSLQEHENGLESAAIVKYFFINRIERRIAGVPGAQFLWYTVLFFSVEFSFLGRFRIDDRTPSSFGLPLPGRHLRKYNDTKNLNL